MKIVIGLRSKT